MEVLIGGVTFTVNTTLTKEFYLSQNKITDDCTCSDCVFFFEKLIKEPFELFQILQNLGIDIGKNLSTEPTGAWCVRDDNGELIHCDHAYQMVGSVRPQDGNQVQYSKFEKGYRITAIFTPSDPDIIYIALYIDRVSDDKEFLKYYYEADGRVNLVKPDEW